MEYYLYNVLCQSVNVPLHVRSVMAQGKGKCGYFFFYLWIKNDFITTKKSQILTYMISSKFIKHNLWFLSSSISRMINEFLSLFENTFLWQKEDWWFHLMMNKKSQQRFQQKNIPQVIWYVHLIIMPMVSFLHLNHYNFSVTVQCRFLFGNQMLYSYT